MKLNSYNAKLTVKELREAVGMSEKQFAAAMCKQNPKHYDLSTESGRWWFDWFESQNLFEVRADRLLRIAKALNCKFFCQFELPSGHFVAVGDKPDEED